MMESFGTDKLGALVAPIGLVVVLALGVSSAQAGRLTDSAGNPVVDNYGECWDAVGGSKAIMEACGDVIPVEPEPAMVEVVTTPTAKTVTTTIKQRVTIAAEMLFGFDSAELSEDAKTVIDERIQTLRGGVQLSSAMRVEGHTDSTGPEAYNMKLSQRRAQAVADYIVSESYNVTASDIEVVGMGESNPIASNATREGRAQNRRVVIEAQGIQEK